MALFREAVARRQTQRGTLRNVYDNASKIVERGRSYAKRLLSLFFLRGCLTFSELVVSGLVNFSITIFKKVRRWNKATPFRINEKYRLLSCLKFTPSSRDYFSLTWFTWCRCCNRFKGSSFDKHKV